MVHSEILVFDSQMYNIFTNLFGKQRFLLKFYLLSIFTTKYFLFDTHFYKGIFKPINRMRHFSWPKLTLNFSYEVALFTKDFSYIPLS